MTCIYILGGPGSGKTTLANRISYQLTIPCYELDLIGWEKGVGTRLSAYPTLTVAGRGLPPRDHCPFS
jgi:broad-specificity NMP kinase